MIHFLMGIVMLGIGIHFLKSILNYSQANKIYHLRLDLEIASKELQLLKLERESLKSQVIRLASRPKPAEPSLSDQVMLDVQAREDRYKDTIRWLLKKCDQPDEAINRILATLDQPELYSQI